MNQLYINLILLHTVTASVMAAPSTSSSVIDIEEEINLGDHENLSLESSSEEMETVTQSEPFSYSIDANQKLHSVGWLSPLRPNQRRDKHGNVKPHFLLGR